MLEQLNMVTQMEILDKLLPLQEESQALLFNHAKVQNIRLLWITGVFTGKKRNSQGCRLAIVEG